MPIQMEGLSTTGIEIGIVNHEDISASSFEQHDDRDVVLPDRIAMILLCSAQTFLTASIVAAVYKRYGLFSVLFIVYFTSVWHWHRPRYSSFARKADLLAVATAISYASYVASTLSITYILIWSCGISLVAIIFALNEFIFFMRVLKNFHGPGNAKNNVWATFPNTAERECAYKINAWVHCVGVHCIAAGLSMAIVIGIGTPS